MTVYYQFGVLGEVESPPGEIGVEALLSEYAVGGAMNLEQIEAWVLGVIVAATMEKGGEPFIWEVTEETALDAAARIYEFISERT